MENSTLSTLWANLENKTQKKNTYNILYTREMENGEMEKGNPSKSEWKANKQTNPQDAFASSDTI